MSWYELVKEWDLTIEGTQSVGTGTSAVPYYKGNGIRVFAEVGTDAIHLNGTAYSSLPAIDDAMIDPASSSTYQGIKAVSINYKRTHSACGAGRTVVVSYSSKETQIDVADNEADGIYDGALDVISIDANSGWAWYSGTATGSAVLSGAVDGRVEQPIQFVVPTGTFSKRIDIKSDNDFISWRTAFCTVVGRVNDSTGEGFGIGDVLLNSFSAKKGLNEFGNDEWQIEVNYMWRIQPCSIAGTDGQSHDGWQYVPMVDDSTAQTVLTTWQRPVAVERDSQGGIASNLRQTYEYADIWSVVTSYGGKIFT